VRTEANPIQKMKRWQKLLIALLLLLCASQIPFAYRRFKLSRLRGEIQQLNANRLSHTAGNYTEYKGVVHVHSFLGGHSSGNFEDIISAAKANGLDFVVMTEHPGKTLNTAEFTLRGVHDGVVFVNGNEVATSEGNRVLIIPGNEVTGKSGEHATQSLFDTARTRREFSVIAYPSQFTAWHSDGFDGIEVYNVYTNAQHINPLIMFFDGLWSSAQHQSLLFANFYQRPDESLARWDEQNQKRRVTGISGNDAHANIGISLNDSSGKRLLGLRLDPYETSFQLVRVHILAPRDASLDEGMVVEALKSGHCFIGFDLFGDTTGFSFSAQNQTETIQGDEIALTEAVQLTVLSPIPARLVLYRDGKAFQEEALMTRKDFRIEQRGSYRVELYLPQLPHRVSQQPWIISNPIYVR